ncbi:hypothetical protein MMC22_012095, partial [Lobaria immixta]|nr:hypothetical protein [Lobaria immixta]
MEEKNTRYPKPNEFIIPPYEAYAMTDIETWQAAEFLMTKLEPVPLEDLDHDDRECTICQQEFCVSEDANLSHPPVKTVCGHNFGKLCITRWLDPVCFWGLAEGAHPTIHGMDTSLLVAANSCPTCREVFFPQPDREPMELLAARLWLWDNAYAFAGVARSEIEERSREHLWKYVKYCRSINEFELSDKVQHEFFVDSFSNLLQYAQRLKLIPLTPVQEALRKRLEKLGGLQPLGTIWKAED